MKSLLLTLIIMASSSLIGMDKVGVSVEQEREAEKIAGEVAALKKLEYKKKILEVLSWPVQPESMEVIYYATLTTFCQPEYVPFIERLIQQRIISPNAYSRARDGGQIYTLFSEAIAYAREQAVPFDNIGMVQLLLEKGASVDRESAILSVHGEGKRSVTPLMRVLECKNKNALSLANLLLQYKADPNKLSQGVIPFMRIVGEYIYEIDVSEGKPSERSNHWYSFIETCLSKYGASPKIPSICPYDSKKKVYTPLQYAQEKGRSELVALFKQYDR